MSPQYNSIKQILLTSRQLFEFAAPSQPETSAEVKKVQVPTAAELFGNDAFAGAPSVPASDAEEVAAKESHTMSEVGAPAAQPRTERVS